MATQTEAKELYAQLSGADAIVDANELGESNNKYDKEAHDIYSQAHDHRERLIDFYIRYTVWFSVLVAALVVLQAIIRITAYDLFEIMPQWTLNLVITGMFCPVCQFA